jgi:hypothetical protein
MRPFEKQPFLLATPRTRLIKENGRISKTRPWSVTKIAQSHDTWQLAKDERRSGLLPVIGELTVAALRRILTCFSVGLIPELPACAPRLLNVAGKRYSIFLDIPPTISLRKTITPTV